jgi:radical SAM protein with 4Fe4S-binding SPASM domain
MVTGLGKPMRQIMPAYETHPVVMWELTRACDLHCRNCTIGATDSRGANELTTYEAYKTIDQIAGLTPRELIMTGGDPLERGDIDQIVNYARRRGLDPALVLSPTSQLTGDAIERVERSGLTRIVLSIDGSTPEIHEARHGVHGTFAVTMWAAGTAKSANLAIEINTLITRRNAGDLEAIADLIRSIGIARWNLYFQVPLATSHTELISAAETEILFGIIDQIRGRETFAVRVIEAPHYRRYRLQRSLDVRLDNAANANWSDFSGYEPDDNNGLQDVMESALDGARDFVFISHAGDVRASEFLPFSAGNLRYRPLGSIYRGSDLLVALRDPENLQGKCGSCEYRRICGGSRARAWAMEWNVFADDPLCAYEPGFPMPLPASQSPHAEA